MNFVARLATGDVALWRVFWLLDVPFALVWDITGLSMLTGYGVGAPLVAIVIGAVFTLASAVLPFVSVAVWRSASRYPREAWWKHALAWSAKLCAVFSGLSAGISFCVVLYLAFSFIYAGEIPF
ncbi:MAG: hypothetical protein WA776_18920 [Xanthobacteraceae bacterium]